MPVKTTTKLLIFAGLVTLVMIVQYFWPEFGQANVIRIEPTGHSVTYNIGDRPSFHSNGANMFFLLTREGITGRTTNMDVSWTEFHSLNRPIMVTRGNFVAIGETHGGRNVYVFDTDGLLYRVEMPDPVQTFSINPSGVLVVVVQTSYGHGVHVFTPQRYTESIYHKRFVGAMQQPTGVDISECGRYIAIAVWEWELRLGHTLMIGYINESDYMMWTVEYGVFASESFDMQTIFAIRFMADSRLVVLLDSQILCFQVTSRAYAVSHVSFLWDIQMENYFEDFMFYDNRHFALVTGDRRVGVMDGSPPGTVYIIGVTDGQPVGSYSLGRRVTHLSMGHNAVIVGADRNFHAVEFDGTLLWEHNSLHETTDVIFLNDTDTILIAGAHRAEVHERRRVRVSDFEDVFD